MICPPRFHASAAVISLNDAVCFKAFKCPLDVHYIRALLSILFYKDFIRIGLYYFLTQFFTYTYARAKTDLVDPVHSCISIQSFTKHWSVYVVTESRILKVAQTADH